MKVYHGSYMAIDNIDFSYCHKKRDFGKGFYVTKILTQAEYWATRKGEDNDTDGIVTEFDFDEYFFKEEDFKVLRFDGYNGNWLDFIVLNRTNRNDKQAHDYDIIEGPVADDDIATRVYDYINGKVSQDKFLSELTHRHPSHQICFCTLKSLQAIKKVVKYDFEYNLKNITKQIILTLVADGCFEKDKAADTLYNSKTFARLADKTTRFYEKDWTEIYKLLSDEINQ
ncbi:MAG: DUF3990 domain-containing protein [Prevotellaceae bacterium]|nr:DUF3990 domain-containing protein [Prevotellaceae bacterium]